MGEGEEKPLGPEGLAARFAVAPQTLARLEAHLGLLRQWAERINLVGRATLADPWRRHILDSAQLLPFVPAGTKSLVDLGSGAGFPGLVLAILGVSGVELIEADLRKGAFLREAARVAAAPVTIHARRSEMVPARAFDVVTARALAPLDRLLALAEPFLGPATLCLFLKGERAAEELAAARRRWTFEASLYPSAADPRGVVLRLSGIVRRCG
ncbi:MAG TPA: 16S rRNA (guanine(527)-N(7))-methyltransferase RsmG [Stellaceae bacterium]|nr:16S rRNA (guanine(527)-N(7))-methyltransferase RsmG [Stellaceae bacterium]